MSVTNGLPEMLVAVFLAPVPIRGGRARAGPRRARIGKADRERREEDGKAA